MHELASLRKQLDLAASVFFDHYRQLYQVRVDTLNSAEPYSNDRYQVQCSRYANRRNRKLYISE